MFATLVLLGLVFAIVSNRSSIKTGKVSNTQNYLNNYKYEATIVIDNAIYHEKNISAELKNFTEYFIDYAEEKGVGLGVMYLYSYNDQIFIGNYLEENASISDLGITLQPEHEYQTDFDDSVPITVGQDSYTFTFSSQREVELKTLVIQNE